MTSDYVGATMVVMWREEQTSSECQCTPKSSLHVSELAGLED
jgi:hypothetical protein